jgi:hypothetical protein
MGFSATTTSGNIVYNWTIGTDRSDGGKFKIASSTALGTSDRLVIDGNGNVGLGTAAPNGLLDIYQANTATNMRLSKSGSLYANFTVENTTGDLTIAITSATGRGTGANGWNLPINNIYAKEENLWLCEGGDCPSTTASTTAGNLFLEHSVTFLNNFSINATSTNTYELGVWDHTGKLIMVFDEEI